MNRKKIISSCMFCLIFSAAAFSHTMWLTADNYNPKPGERVTIEIGWGHGLDKKTAMRDGIFNQIVVISTDGEKIIPDKIDALHYSFKANKSGFYAIGADIIPGFMTKTTTGLKFQDKKGLVNSVNCMNYDIRAKTVIKAGNEKSNPQIQVKHPVEIIPLDDISILKKGGVLNVMVLFKGKAVENCAIDVDREGHKHKDNDGQGVSIKTDSKGKARIKLPNKGKWMLHAKYGSPYPDKDVCDNYTYGTSLVFIVK
jgi:uncharacterized GH25 family protein